MRRDARDAVYKILYADLFNDNDEVFEKEMFGESKLSKEDLEFARSLLNVINEHKSEIEEKIWKTLKQK